MNQQEFRKGLVQALGNEPCGCSNCEADAVIACPEVQQLYVKVMAEQDGYVVPVYVPLADWLKEAKP